MGTARLGPNGSPRSSASSSDAAAFRRPCSVVHGQADGAFDAMSPQGTAADRCVIARQKKEVFLLAPRGHCAWELLGDCHCKCCCVAVWTWIIQRWILIRASLLPALDA